MSLSNQIFTQIKERAQEKAQMDAMSQKIVYLCELNLNQSFEFMSQIMKYLILFLSIVSWLFLWFLVMLAVILLYNLAPTYFLYSWSSLFFIGDHSRLEGLMMNLLFFIPGYFSILAYQWIKSINIFERLKKDMLTLFYFYKESSQKVGIKDIDDILKQSQKIKSIISLIINMGRLKFIFSDTSKEQIKPLVSIAISLSSMILIELRSDLQFQLREQQKTLEWAKLEIEKYLVGSQEILKVSELQKIRLDRQIEQFEKLQQRLT